VGARLFDPNHSISEDTHTTTTVDRQDACPQQNRVVGTKPIRHDGLDKVTEQLDTELTLNWLACCTERYCAVPTLTRASGHLIPAKRKPCRGYSP